MPPDELGAEEVHRLFDEEARGRIGKGSPLLAEQRDDTGRHGVVEADAAQELDATATRQHIRAIAKPGLRQVEMRHLDRPRDVPSTLMTVRDQGDGARARAGGQAIPAAAPGDILRRAVIGHHDVTVEGSEMIVEGAMPPPPREPGVAPQDLVHEGRIRLDDPADGGERGRAGVESVGCAGLVTMGCRHAAPLPWSFPVLPLAHPTAGAASARSGPVFMCTLMLARSQDRDSRRNP